MVTTTSSSTLSVPTRAPADPAAAAAVKAADQGLHLLLADPAFQLSLGNASSGVTSDKIVSTLWSGLKQSGTAVLKKDDVQRAIAALGGTTAMADGLWTQLNPGKKVSIGADEFSTNSYLRNAVDVNLKSEQTEVESALAKARSPKDVVSLSSPATLAVPTAAPDDPGAAAAVRAADQALHLFLSDSEFQTSLVDQTTKYVPASVARIMSTLWGGLNQNGAAVLTKDDVSRAVYAFGGGSILADGLWSQISPDGKTEVNASDFATNKYLTGAVTANLQAEQTEIELTRQKNAGASGNSGTMLDFSMGKNHHSGSMLDFFA